MTNTFVSFVYFVVKKFRERQLVAGISENVKNVVCYTPFRDIGIFRCVGLKPDDARGKAFMPSEFIEEIDDDVIVEGGVVTEGVSNDYGRMWNSLVAAQEQQTVVSAIVVDAIKGGLVVDLGVRGFIPKSEIATRNLTNLERFIGQSLEAKVLEADRDSGRVVLSQRVVAEEKRAVQRAETLSTLEQGQTIEGVVRRITDFGAFVDIGGIDGLLHISDMSWENVASPNEIVKVGDNLQLLVLRIERDGERISLGLKQLQEDPWNEVRRTIREGDVVEVCIERVEQAGAMGKIQPLAVEAFIPTSEIAPRRGGDEAPIAVEAGQTVSAKVLEVRNRERSIILSLRQAVRERERTEIRDYMKKQQRTDDGPPTLGDLFSDVFSKLKKKN